MTLPSQRSSFELPDTMSYMDAAAWSPLPHRVRAAGEAGILAKSQPWAHPREAARVWTERARSAAARLIGATDDDVAIVGSVSHAIATAARNLPLAPGSRLLRVADEYSSLCLAWDRLAAEHGLIIDTVARPADADWTTAIAAAIARPGAPELAVATLTPLHWADGTVIDLARLAPAIHAAGAAFVIDATQAAGAMPIDVAALRPDFLAFPTYKWTLGPYGVAFLYAAPHRQLGEPLERNSGNGPPAIGARRYDKGELHDPVALPMAATGLEMIAEWGVPAIAARLREVTTALADGAASLGFRAAPAPFRAPHILGLRTEGPLPAELIERLRARDVVASIRQGNLRLSPHVWADGADVDRCLTALADLL